MSTLARTILDRLASNPAPRPEPGLTELLGSSSAVHRRMVGAELGLTASASAEEIGAAVREQTAAIVARLSPDARRLAAQAAFLGHAAVYESWNGRPSRSASELERHGLAFVFRQSYTLAYHVPRDLHALLADALAAPYGRGLSTARPARLLEAPLQLAHDLAALWAHLARSPVRVKTDGAVYQRDVPRLLGALPAFELHGTDDPIARWRLEFVLGMLRDEGLVRVRVDDRPGSDGRRELVVADNPAALLSATPDDLRARLLSHARRAPLGAPALALAASLEPGETVSLESFGAALRTMLEQTGLGREPGATDFALALGGLHFGWLAGGVVLGVDRDGMPSAVRAEPATAPTQPPGRIVCQANFELIALAPPDPAERLALALICEPVPGQAHVFRLTRESVRGAQRSRVLEIGVVATLEQLTGELPQNVARSLADWTSSLRPPLRLRTAMVLDTGDADTAEALLAGQLGTHVVERLGPSQLAIRAGDIPAVQAALRKAGHELDPGLDRVSGRWSEREPTQTEAEQAWTPDAAAAPPGGKQASTLGKAQRQPGTALAQAPQVVTNSMDDEPAEVVLDAIERGADVFIVYAGARGTTQRQITPYEVEGAAVHAYCHLRADERSFWLASILDAVPVRG